jgi:Zn-dependent M32 family carboxypeptidase
MMMDEDYNDILERLKEGYCNSEDVAVAIEEIQKLRQQVCQSEELARQQTMAISQLRVKLTDAWDELSKANRKKELYADKLLQIMALAMPGEE